MKTLLVTVGMILIFVSCSSDDGNTLYPANPKPLLRTKFIKLPLGAVKPEGWLYNQLDIMRQGLTGHLELFWPDLIHSAWKGGDGEAWERGPYYLDGLVPLAFLLEDEELRKRVDVWIDWIAQSSREDGWFGPEKNNDRWPLAIACKVLMQYHEATADPRALDIIEKYFRYLHSHEPDWPDSTWRGVRAMEHAVSGYWLYRRSKDRDILKTIKSIQKNSYSWTAYYETFPWDSAAVANETVPHNWKAEGLTAHVVNNAMAIKYPGLWYQQSKDDRFKNAIYEGLDAYDRHHGQVGGRFSGDEHLSGKSPVQGTELCAVVELMYSMEKLFEIFGDVAFGDRLELLAYNALSGTMTPDGWAHQYDQQSNQVLVSVAERDWSTNGPTSNIYGLMPNYPCCLANLHQGWPKLVQHMWMATRDQGLVAAVYGPCEVTARVGDGKTIMIEEITDYPFADSIRFRIHTDEPVSFPIYFRIPKWCNGAKLAGKSVALQPAAGEIAMLKQSWRDGDEITLSLPMPLRAERRFNGSVSILRGPLYFALRIGRNYREIELEGKHITSIDYSGAVDWHIEPTTAWNYALQINPESPQGNIRIEINPVRKYPFADLGERLYDTAAQKQITWLDPAPVVLRAWAARLVDWTMKNHSADVPPKSPVNASQYIEPVTLVPYGCTRLRIAEFPVLQE
ncbi:hypothetical protein GF407_14600 [candidate division KSB1 bacterium]|nr:hypothetical protein [candidate division KSB1 bacterium]